MSRLPLIEPADAAPEAKTVLDTVQARLGATPNGFKAMALSPPLLEG